MKHYSLNAVWIVAAVCSATSGTTEAGIFRHGCGPRGCTPPPCAYEVRCTPCADVGGHYETRVVERTICVPEVQTETRNVTVCVLKPQIVERDVNIVKRVPYTETVAYDYTVMVQRTEMRKQTCIVYKPVTREVAQTYTVMVPYQEMRQGVRNVPVCEPATIAHTVCVDRGHWETREVEVPCGGPGYGNAGGYGGGYAAAYGNRGYGIGRAGYGVPGTFFSGYGYGGYGWGYNYGPAPVYSAGYAGYSAGYAGSSCAPACPPPMVKQCVNVWVPNIVQEQVTRTVMRTKFVPQTYDYQVTLCRPEQRTRTVQVCDRVAEQVTTEVPVTICVPEKRTKTCEVTKYKCVTETQKQTHTVMVPSQEQRQVQVQVCKMVPKTIQQTVQVWVSGCATPEHPEDLPKGTPPASPTIAPPAAPGPATF